MVKSYIHIDSYASRVVGIWDSAATPQHTEGSLQSTTVNCRSLLSQFKTKYTRIRLTNCFFNLECAGTGASTVSGVDGYGLIGLNVYGLNVKSTDTTTASRSVMKTFADGNLTMGATNTYNHNFISLQVGGDEESGVIVETDYLRNIDGLGVIITFNLYGGSFYVAGRVAEGQYVLELSSVEEEDL